MHKSPWLGKEGYVGTFTEIRHPRTTTPGYSFNMAGTLIKKWV